MIDICLIYAVGTLQTDFILTDVWRLHFGILSFNFQRQRPSLQGDLFAHAKISFIQEFFLGTALASWNRGRPVQEIFSC